MFLRILRSSTKCKLGNNAKYESIADGIIYRMRKNGEITIQAIGAASATPLYTKSAAMKTATTDFTMSGMEAPKTRFCSCVQRTFGQL